MNAPAKQLPEGWKSRRLKYVATHNDEVLAESTDDFEELRYIEISDVSLVGGIEGASNLYFHEAPSRARRRVRSGDILISTVRTYLKAIAAVPSAEPNLIASTGFCVVRPMSCMDSAYLGWVAKSEPFVGEIVARSTGVSYPAINPSELATLDVPLPPLGTQRRIARFLDQKTARIDALIQKKRALLDRLAEKRQALITHAVTKGLNPNAQMKESGVDLLGKIPAHWECSPLKRLVEGYGGLQMGPFGGMLTNLPEEETGYKLYGQENTISGNFSLGRRWIEPERFLDLKRYELIEGDLVITRKGSLGNCRKAPEKMLPGIIDSDTIRIRPDQRKLQSEWAILLLHDALFISAQIASERRGAILSGLNTTVVGALLLTLPPINEQIEVLNKIAPWVSSLDAAKSKIGKSIDRLNEYRAALITSAVTGKMLGLQ
jgi:type I restriction enzyme S subunit